MGWEASGFTGRRLAQFTFNGLSSRARATTFAHFADRGAANSADIPCETSLVWPLAGWRAAAQKFKFSQAPEDANRFELNANGPHTAMDRLEPDDSS